METPTKTSIEPLNLEKKNDKGITYWELKYSGEPLCHKCKKELKYCLKTYFCPKRRLLLCVDCENAEGSCPSLCSRHMRCYHYNVVAIRVDDDKPEP